MKDDDRPLHVRVAEALGWFNFQPSLNGLWPDEWRGHPPQPIVGETHKEVPRYDTDWSATGPLIEQRAIQLTPYGGSDGNVWWMAHPMNETPMDYKHRPGSYGRTALMAVCKLIAPWEAEKSNDTL